VHIGLTARAVQLFFGTLFQKFWCLRKVGFTFLSSAIVYSIADFSFEDTRLNRTSKLIVWYVYSRVPQLNGNWFVSTALEKNYIWLMLTLITVFWKCVCSVTFGDILGVLYLTSIRCWFREIGMSISINAWGLLEISLNQIILHSLFYFLNSIKYEAIRKRMW